MDGGVCFNSTPNTSCIAVIYRLFQVLESRNCNHDSGCRERRCCNFSSPASNTQYSYLRLFVCSIVCAIMHHPTETGRLKFPIVGVKRPIMMHDFAITKNYAVFLDFPLLFKPELMLTGQVPIAFDETAGSRFVHLNIETLS